MWIVLILLATTSHPFLAYTTTLVSSSSSQVQIKENAPIGTPLATFCASNPENIKISFLIDRLSDPHRRFSINHEGIVKIRRHLDREVTSRHQVKILAIDDDDPPKTSTATLTVIVQDINDNAPKFLKDYRPVLPEHVPPRKVVEILATDDDDRSKSNGPPFQFRLDPGADDIIRASFKVEQDQKGANGDGMAIVSSLRSFDREQQKEYLIPIVIIDHGNPAMTGTSTLTVEIGNEMGIESEEIIDSDPCLDNPCENEGICQKLEYSESDHYQCNCSPGYTGNNCEFAPAEGMVLLMLSAVCLAVILIGLLIFLTMD